MIAGRFERRAGHEGFTLVELTITIAITLALSALLLTAVGRSQDSAKSAQCVSNLRQLSQAAQMYASENDGKIVPSRISRGPDGYWPYLLAPFLGLPKQGTTPTGSMRKTIYMCPSKKADASGNTEYTLGVYTIRYSINSHIAEASDLLENPLVARAGRMAQMAQTKTMLFIDAFQGGVGWASTIAPTYPHQDRANAAYLDGHVESKTMQDIERYRRYPFHVFWRGYDWGYGGYRED